MFFFFKQKTAYEMRISDWSSDVCSSDLAVLTPAQRRVSAARTALAWRGLYEGVTFSFVSRRQAELFGGGGEALTLANPISADLDVMRPTPLANLAVAAVRKDRKSTRLNSSH